jgi:GNAT superfamily N-acetyltransferase
MASAEPLALTPFKPQWREPCRQVLAGLPEWFAASAVEAYTAELGRFPSWVATPSAGAVALGCVSVSAPQPSAFEVHLLAVARAAQRQGVGSALLEVAERWARRCGARLLQVKTTGPSSPDPAFVGTRAFYVARGFTPLFESDRLWGPENPALVLVKAL